MANLYDDSDEMDDFIDYENYNNQGANYGNPSMYMNQPPSVAFGGASAYGPSMGYGGGNFGTKHRDPLSGGGTIGFGQASRFGRIGDSGNPFGLQQTAGRFGVDTIGTDYVDLSNVKAPEMNKFQPNKFATSSKSSLKKPGKRKDEGRGVSFGDVTTFHVDKESNLTETDKKSKSEDDEDDYDDEDEIENKALENKLKETAKEKKSNEEKKTNKTAAKDSTTDAAKPGTIASMLKKIANIEESITESGSVGLKKSLESEEYRISSSNDDLPKPKANQKEISTKQKSPSGLSDSLENPHLKSHELDSKKHSSEYDSAELSRNFNYDESEDTLKAKSKSIPSKKSGDNDTEYDDDFESTSNLYDSSMNKSKKSNDKFDEIEEIRKRNLQYKSNLEAFKGGLKTSDEHEEEISKRLDSYRAKDEIKEESEGSSPQISKKDSPVKVKPATLSSDENKLLELMRKDVVYDRNNLELKNQDLTNEKYQKEIEAKKFEMDAQVSRMEALNANETIKRMKEQILKYAQEVNVYRVEIEGLKRQIDISDSNAKTKEEDAKRIQEDYERKIKLAEERYAVQSVKQESREVNELKRENRLLKDAHDEEMRVKFEEVDYLTKRCEKLEAENVSLRVGNKAARDAEAKAKKYEEEVHSLRMRLKEQLLSKEAAPVAGSNYNNWTKEQLVRELLCIDRAIERFTKENETLMFENKKQAAEIQELNALLYKESQKIEDFKNKIVKETGSVIVAEDDKELHIKSVKDLGVNHVISKKELDDTRDRLFKAEKAKIDIEQLMNMKEVEYKSEIENLRQQKIESERKLIGMDSALKTQIMENDRLKEDYSNSLNKVNQQKEEANQKVKWYMENQGIIEKDSEALHQKDARIEQLKEEVKTLQAKDGGRQKMMTLEKQVKDLQSALASKNPDSLPLMLSAVKPSFEEQEEYRKLKDQNESLNKALQEKDADFDKRMRTLRIEIDKMREQYESTKTAGLSEGVKDKRIQDLERQLQETKDYYIDRLKKLEQKTGPAGIIAEKKVQINNDMAYLKEIERLKKENETLKKSTLKAEKPGKDIKINSKDKPLDLSGAVDKLMKEDYIFSL